MKFPSPAVLEIVQEDESLTAYASTVFYDGNRLVWNEYQEPERLHTLDVMSAEESYGTVNAVLADGSVTIRPIDPYDGVKIAPEAGVPQPLRVLKKHVLQGGGVAAYELSAVVAADNTVATLMLDTGEGVYVRYSGDWQLLKDDSDALDGAQVVTVGPDALTVFDKADAAKTTLSVFDLPRYEISSNGTTVEVRPESLAASVDTTPDLGMFRKNVTLVASGISIPVVNDEEDLETAVRYAENHPASRWYVVKRAQALGLSASVPPEWLPRPVVHPF